MWTTLVCNVYTKQRRFTKSSWWAHMEEGMSPYVPVFSLWPLMCTMCQPIEVSLCPEGGHTCSWTLSHCPPHLFPIWCVDKGLFVGLHFQCQLLQKSHPYSINHYSSIYRPNMQYSPQFNTISIVLRLYFRHDSYIFVDVLLSWGIKHIEKETLPCLPMPLPVFPLSQVFSKYLFSFLEFSKSLSFSSRCLPILLTPLSGVPLPKSTPFTQISTHEEFCDCSTSAMKFPWSGPGR